MGRGADLPEPLEALLGVVLAGGGKLDALPQQARSVVPLHHLQRPRRPECAPEHSPARHRCDCEIGPPVLLPPAPSAKALAAAALGLGRVQEKVWVWALVGPRVSLARCPCVRPLPGAPSSVCGWRRANLFFFNHQQFLFRLR